MLTNIKIKNIIIILAVLLLVSQFLFAQQENQELIQGRWFDCDVSSLNLGDTILFKRDSCIFENKTTFDNQRQWELQRNRKFDYFLTGTILQSGGNGSWSTVDNKLIITRNYNKGIELEQYRILKLSKFDLLIIRENVK